MVLTGEDQARLEQANHQVVQSMQRVCDQQQRLASLAHAGHDTTQAGKLLAALQLALQQRIQHRHEIIVSLGKQRSAMRHQGR